MRLNSLYMYTPGQNNSYKSEIDAKDETNNF